MRALLDVNFFIALLDPDHFFHDRAHNYWHANKHWGWASCPLTENGAIRIMANPNYRKNRRFTVDDVISLICQFAAGTDHEFWPDDISYCDGKTFLTSGILSSRLLTDLYLLSLAVKHGGRLITFDQGIPMSSVVDATADHLVVI